MGTSPGARRFGDCDNQISPANVGIRVHEVEALQSKHLAGFELRDLLTTEHSLFDQAKVRYTGELWLTEHFRCMPEIIEFSNRLIYAPQHRKLTPLRQYGADRLSPLRRVHVPDGRREGSVSHIVNRAEAEAVAQAIVECHHDPAYSDKTFGVVSLLSTSSQAKHIERLLMDRLEPRDWRERNLRCGSAYDFQGDERDVMFASMVVSLEDGQAMIRKLGSDRDRRSYNVAASRARDQMWLFHSMTLDQLNPDCVRFALLNHFMSPLELGVEGFTDEVDRERRHPSFDSLFEQRVFLDIRDRGFVVVPQVEAYGRSIDLVVVGAGTKIAVECDGAEWHGPEQWASDLSRQRDLERVGWTFFRVRDTDYYLDAESALEPLWALLRDAGIFPAGAAVEEPSPTQPEMIGGSSDGPRQVRARLDGSERPSSPTTALRSVPDYPAVPDGLDALSGEVDAIPEQGGSRSSVPEESDRRPEPQAGEGVESFDDPMIARERPAGTDFSKGHTRAPGQSATGGLEPYHAWTPTPIRDPLALSARELADVLVVIIDVEGPMIAERAYQLANGAAGNKRLGKDLRSAMNRAMKHAIVARRIALDDPFQAGGYIKTTVRTPAQPPVRCREFGPRSRLEHVPPREIAAVLSREDLRPLDEETRHRRALEMYGMKRLTAAARRHLRWCEQI